MGDIKTYVGKKTLIFSGFHEAALTAYAIKQAFDPDTKVSVQYTSASPHFMKNWVLRLNAMSHYLITCVRESIT